MKYFYHSALSILCILLHLSFSTSQTCPSGKKPTTTGNTAKFSSIEGELSATELPTEYDAKGLQAFFDLANSFMNTVQGDSFAEKFKGEDLEDIIDNFSDFEDKLIDYEKPILVAVGFGVLFILLMLIVGPIFCCCRCCGKCGGKMYQDPKAASRHTCCCAMAFILLIVAIFILCGVLFMFVTNNRTHETAQDLEKTYQTVINDVVNIANSTIQVANKIPNEVVPCIGALLKDDVSDNGIKLHIGVPIHAAVTANVSDNLDRALVEAESLDLILASLNQIISLKTTLEDTLTTLKSELNGVKTDLDTAANDCQVSAAGDPSLTARCNEIADYKNKVDVTTEYSDLPDVTSERDRVKSVIDKDLKQKINDAKKMIADIPDTVNTKSRSARDDVIKEIDDAPAEVKKELDDVIKDLEDSIINEKQKLLDDGKKYLSPDGDYLKYEKYRWYAYIGISCLVAFIFVLLALGLTFGTCGYRKDRLPSNRTKVATCGGNCLMASVGFIFIFSWILMIFCVVWYAVGIHFYIVCRDIKDGGLLDDLSGERFKWDGKRIAVADTLKNCRNNLPLYTALNGKNYYNLTEKFDIKKHTDDIQKKIDDISFDLSDQEVLTTDTENELNEVITTGVEDVNYTSFFITIRKKITENDLKVISFNITEQAKEVQAASPSLATSLNNIATKLDNIDSGSITTIQNNLNVLEPEISKTQTLANNTKIRTEELLVDLKANEAFIQVETVQIIKDKIKILSDRMIGWLDQGSAFLIDEVEDDLLRCKPVADLYDGFINTLVCDDVVQNANGFWLALGWCLLFFVPALIFAVRLAKYFRRMEYDSGYDNDVQHPPYNDKIPLHHRMGKTNKIIVEEGGVTQPPTAAKRHHHQQQPQLAHRDNPTYKPSRTAQSAQQQQQQLLQQPPPYIGHVQRTPRMERAEQQQQLTLLDDVEDVNNGEGSVTSYDQHAPPPYEENRGYNHQ